MQLGTHTFTPSRILRSDLLIPSFRRSSRAEQKRLGVAISQYHAALRDWTTAGQPLALMHLYPALEALGGAVERAERARLGLADKEAHARHRGVDVDQIELERSPLGWVRRDVICKGGSADVQGGYDGQQWAGARLCGHALDSCCCSAGHAQALRVRTGRSARSPQPRGRCAGPPAKTVCSTSRHSTQS